MATGTKPPYDRRTPRDRRLRVGDTERDAISEILRSQHVEGRLDNDEFQERIERCLTAKTYAELDALVADFPNQQSEQARVGRRWGWHPWPFALLPLAVIATVVLAGGHLVWLAFPVFFLFIVRPLFLRTWPRGTRRRCGPRYSTRSEP
jgi:Domain of unknown function (DUF1707)